MTEETALQTTPLHSQHVEAGAKMVPFAGFDMPLRYSGQVEEHHAVRRAVGVFDVSHMGEIVLRGPGADAFAQWATPNDVGRLRIGRAHYSSLLDDDGRLLDDLLVYRRGENDLLLVVNGATRAADVRHLGELLGRWEGAAVELDDQSDRWALIAVQGPLAEGVVTAACERLGGPPEVAALRYYGFTETAGGQGVIVSRTGYTGEDGFEIYVAAEQAVTWWRTVHEIGAARGLLPCGLAARDTLRLEAGMLLSGQDLGPHVTPLEVGLGWTVKLDKGDFVGRDALARQQRDGLERRLVGFELVERAIARHGDRLSIGESGGEDSLAGEVTSGSWSPTLERGIGLAVVEGRRGFAAPAAGTAAEIAVRGRSVAARIVALPFYRRPTG
ncbi:MAG: glycine cleavage system aminomethyltransferase GcvT [Acidobacteria bacterium]|nr:MAG: glycine cleavage system aminomethyltransferase GcvT [Acidobacteriota bacterium]REK10326.1 MAG: glycine cleavage system aminomethyltransferase GcvT [Acidobacteriota bacterium]